MENLQLLSRSEMKEIKAGDRVCNYLVGANGWTGRLDGCSVTTFQVEGGIAAGGVGATGGFSSTTEECCYTYIDQYGFGSARTRMCIPGAAARQC